MKSLLSTICLSLILLPMTVVAQPWSCIANAQYERCSQSGIPGCLFFPVVEQAQAATRADASAGALTQCDFTLRREVLLADRFPNRADVTNECSVVTCDQGTTTVTPVPGSPTTETETCTVRSMNTERAVLTASFKQFRKAVKKARRAIKRGGATSAASTVGKNLKAVTKAQKQIGDTAFIGTCAANASCAFGGATGSVVSAAKAAKKTRRSVNKGVKAAGISGDEARTAKRSVKDAFLTFNQALQAYPANGASCRQ